MMKKQLLSTTFALMALTISADEGMWMLTDLKAQNEAAMMDLGLQIPIEEVYNPDGIALKDAVVHFGGGCTGEIISAEGLVLTNHHCGYGAIQQHSSVDHDYLTDGFWAMSRNEELPCKGLTVTFIDRILDVTDYVNEQLKKMMILTESIICLPNIWQRLPTVSQRRKNPNHTGNTPGTETVLWR